MSIEISPVKVALRVAARSLAKVTRARRTMQFPTYSPAVAERIEQYHDEIRYSMLALAIQRLEIDKIPGAFAEIGVTELTPDDADRIGVQAADALAART